MAMNEPRSILATVVSTAKIHGCSPTISGPFAPVTSQSFSFARAIRWLKRIRHGEGGPGRSFKGIIASTQNVKRADLIGVPGCLALDVCVENENFALADSRVIVLAYQLQYDSSSFIQHPRKIDDSLGIPDFRMVLSSMDSFIKLWFFFFQKYYLNATSFRNRRIIPIKVLFWGFIGWMKSPCDAQHILKFGRIFVQKDQIVEESLLRFRYSVIWLYATSHLA